MKLDFNREFCLDVHVPPLADVGAGLVANYLEGNSSIVWLGMDGNDVGFYGACDIAKALKANTVLTYLDMNWNKIGDGGATVISDALKVNSALKTLLLERTGISVSGAESLSHALQVNTCLETLNLEGNPLTYHGIMYISEALKHNSTLKNLNLSDTVKRSGCRDAGRFIGEALMQNTGLVTLCITENEINDYSSWYIFEALKTNSTLAQLNMSINELRFHGTWYLSDALKVNTSLTDLRISDNWINDDAFWHLADALRFNSSLTKLDISNNYLLNVGAGYIENALRDNVTLTSLNITHKHGPMVRDDMAIAIWKWVLANKEGVLVLQLTARRDGAMALVDATTLAGRVVASLALPYGDTAVGMILRRVQAAMDWPTVDIKPRVCLLLPDGTRCMAPSSEGMRLDELCAACLRTGSLSGAGGL